MKNATLAVMVGPVPAITAFPEIVIYPPGAIELRG